MLLNIYQHSAMTEQCVLCFGYIQLVEAVQLGALG